MTTHTPAGRGGPFRHGRQPGGPALAAPFGRVVADPANIPEEPAPTFLFFDDWESANMSTTNTDGFSWGSNNRTSVVTMENSVPFAVYNNGVIHNQGAGGSDWNAYAGDHSLRFRYPSGTNSFAEQRYDLGGAYLDLWFRYWLRVPTNYEHRTNSPSNKKLFVVFMDAYEGAGDGSTIIWQLRPDGSDGSDANFQFSSGQFTGSGAETGATALISSPADQGRWMQLAFHIKAASSRGANDGVLELHRKWDGGSFTQIHNVTNIDIAPIPGGPPHGWEAGYVMGWSNPGYDVATEWLMDEFTISESSLI